jgi:predicted porin
MKKSLIALAALAAVTAASAQSTVTVRGNIDVGLTAANVNGTKTTSMTSGLASTSKLIIEGTEDLGGGMKARFYTETGLLATTHLGTSVTSSTASTTTYVSAEQSSTMIGSRGIYVGLVGGFGEINMGRIPHQTGAFGIGFAGVQNAFSNAVGAGSAHPGQNSDALLTSQAQGRANNSFLYTTPTISGISAKIQHSLGGGTGDDSAGSRTTYVLGYSNGPIALEAMASERSSYAANATGDANSFTPAQTGAWSAYAEGAKVSESAFGAKYDLGVAVLGLGYAKQDSTSIAGALTTLSATGVSVALPVGPWTLVGGYARINPVSNAAAYNSTSFSGQYAFSKRTTAYAAFRSNNQASGKDSLNIIGLNHVF